MIHGEEELLEEETTNIKTKKLKKDKGLLSVVGSTLWNKGMHIFG